MNIKKEIGIGFLFGLICNIAGVYLYVAILTDYDLVSALGQAYRDDFLGGLLAIGAGANFLPFFVFLKKNQIYRARGVLIFTILMAVAVLTLKVIEIYGLS